MSNTNTYGKTITLTDVTVMYSSLDAPDKWAPDTHNVTVSISEDQLATLQAAVSGARVNGIKNPHSVRDNPDHEYNGLISLKCKSKKAIDKGYMRHPRIVETGIDPNERIMSTDIVSLQVTPVIWGGGPAKGTASFLLDGVCLREVGPRPFLSGGAGWGWDDESISQLDQTVTTQTDDQAPADTTPVPSADDSDIPF